MPDRRKRFPWLYENHYRLLSGCYYTLPNGRVIPQHNFPPQYIHIEKRGGRR